MTIKIRKLDTANLDFTDTLRNILKFETQDDNAIDIAVADILLNIRKQRDVAVLYYTRYFDCINVNNVSALEITQDELNYAWNNLTSAQKIALEKAVDRIRIFHEKQKNECGSHCWQYIEKDGTKLGQRVAPLDRVGIYVPGGKASYPSSVLMNAIPAQVAGVKEIIMTVPTPMGIRNQLVLAAAAIVGINKVFSIGGAQAIGALAYGTDSIPAVDKIVGPGNAYVTCAKRRVFGTVGIDMIAGPSEVLIICDGSTNPHWIAMDLFAQAEHDELAQSILLCPDINFISQVEIAINILLDKMPRNITIRKSLEKRGALIKVCDLNEACKIANIIAAEHVEISTRKPQKWAKKIKNAGAIFLGQFTSESLGDYCAGPNHVLPTSGTSRFFSPLGVYDFMKRSSIIQVSYNGAQKLGKIASTLAYEEGLYAHMFSAQLRINTKI